MAFVVALRTPLKMPQCGLLNKIFYIPVPFLDFIELKQYFS